MWLKKEGTGDGIIENDVFNKCNRIYTDRDIFINDMNLGYILQVYVFFIRFYFVCFKNK